MRAEIVGIRTAVEGSGGYTVNSTFYSLLVFNDNGTVQMVEGRLREISPYLAYVRPRDDTQELRLLLNEFAVKIKNDLSEIVKQELLKLEINRNPIPEIIGKDRKEAKSILKDADLIAIEPGEVDEGIFGIVSGYERNPNSPKEIILKINYSYPQVCGMNFPDAADIMRKAGFIPIQRNVFRETADTVNNVISVLAGEENKVFLCVAVDNPPFTDEIKNEQSMIAIWKKWEDAGLSNRYPKVTALIKKYKDIERMFGKMDFKSVEKYKAEIEQVFLEES